jgi:hypothetical protein
MAEPTSRIEPATSYREPEARTARRSTNEKAGAKPRSATSAAIPPLAEDDEQEKHELDTLA